MFNYRSQKQLYREVKVFKKGQPVEIKYKPVEPVQEPPLVLTESTIFEPRVMVDMSTQTTTTEKKQKTKKKFTEDDWDVHQDEDWKSYPQHYLAGTVKDKSGKTCPVYKTFDEAVEKFNELQEGNLQAGGITQTSRGFQVRRGDNPIKSKELNYKGGLCCYIFKDDMTAEAWTEQQVDSPPLTGPWPTKDKALKWWKTTDKKQPFEEFWAEQLDKNTDDFADGITVADYVVPADEEDEGHCDNEEVSVSEIQDAFGKTWYYSSEGEFKGLYDRETEEKIDETKYSIDYSDDSDGVVVWL